MTEKRVVITGMGAVTPLAHSVEKTWEALLAGRSGVGPITLFDASTFPTNIAGEVKHLDASRWTGRNGFSFLGRNSLFALEAAEEAVKDAGIEAGKMDPARYGIYFGAGDGGFNFNQYASVLMSSMDLESSTVNAMRYMTESTAHADVKKFWNRNRHR